MAQTKIYGERRTSVDDVFDHLYEQIANLTLRPGDRISEAEIAAQFNVSRQPVRDAFNRLATIDLLLIRPQRATEVRRFSMRQIEKARFVRAAIEKEVLLRATANCSDADALRLDEEMALQNIALTSKNVERFGQLDYEFHRVLCGIAKADYAYEVILAEKAKVDRLCMLGLEKEQRMPELVADHQAIVDAIKSHNSEDAIKAGMKHLSRLDETIQRISVTNANYFENEPT